MGLWRMARVCVTSLGCGCSKEAVHTMKTQFLRLTRLVPTDSTCSSPPSKWQLEILPLSCRRGQKHAPMRPMQRHKVSCRPLRPHRLHRSPHHSTCSWQTKCATPKKGSGAHPVMQLQAPPVEKVGSRDLCFQPGSRRDGCPTPPCWRRLQGQNCALLQRQAVRTEHSGRQRRPQVPGS